MTTTAIVPAAADPKQQLALAVTGLEPTSAAELRSAFETMFGQAEEWAARAKTIKVTSVDQKREMKLARESRLALREIRVNAEHARKRLKEDSTRRGKAIDGIANVLKALIEPIEEHLLEQETFAERAETARKAELRKTREDALRAYGANVEGFANLGETSEETWATIHEEAKLAHEARIEAAKQAELVRVEAEKIAAEKRQAERAEAARLEAERVEREKAKAEENARLRAEKERIEAEAKQAAEKAAAERRELEEKARAEREARCRRSLAAPSRTRAASRDRGPAHVAKFVAWIEKAGEAL